MSVGLTAEGASDTGLVVDGASDTGLEVAAASVGAFVAGLAVCGNNVLEG